MWNQFDYISVNYRFLKGTSIINFYFYQFDNISIKYRSAILLKEESHYDEGIVLEAVVEKYVKYFKSILHHNSWYFFKFVCCEMANIVVLFANFWAIDKFLKGRFRFESIVSKNFY